MRLPHLSSRHARNPLLYAGRLSSWSRLFRTWLPPHVPLPCRPIERMVQIVQNMADNPLKGTQGMARLPSQAEEEGEVGEGEAADGKGMRVCL